MEHNSISARWERECNEHKIYERFVMTTCLEPRDCPKLCITLIITKLLPLMFAHFEVFENLLESLGKSAAQSAVDLNSATDIHTHQSRHQCPLHYQLRAC